MSILVADTVGKEVVYSTKCFENTYKQSEMRQTYFELSKTIPKEPVLTAQLYGSSAADCVDNVFTILQSSLGIGMLFTPPPASLALGAIAALGSLIQRGIGALFSDEPDELQKSLERLTLKLKELDEKTTAHFADMKAFITEHQFNVEIISEISTLKSYMQDCTNFRSVESYENFQTAYERNPPLDLGYFLISLLNQRSTNPLIMAMEKKENSTNSVFEKWETIFEALLSDLLLIESFGTGLLYEEDPHDYNKILELKVEVSDFINQYKNDYWKDFKEFFEKFIENNPNLNCAQKADAIKKKLEQYETEDAFYICVMKVKKGQDDFYCYCPKRANQLVEVRNKGNCHAFVYRSMNGKRVSDEEYDVTMKAVNDLQFCKFDPNWNAKKQVFDFLLPKKLVREDGLIALAETWCDPETRVANSPGREVGPGWWVTALFITKGGYEFFVGLP